MIRKCCVVMVLGSLATTASAASTEPFRCGATSAEMARLLSGKRVVDLMPEDDIEPELRIYDPRQFLVMGIQPTSVEVSFSDGVPTFVEMRLNVASARPYIAAFKALVPSRGYSLDCDDDSGCEWFGSKMIGTLPKAALKDMQFERQNAQSFRFECKYF